MHPFTVETQIARPREEIFDYLADVANHPEFTDHFLTDWHMTREDTYGLGAGGRFHADLPFSRFGWGDWTIVEAEPPRGPRAAGPRGQVQPHPHAHRVRAARGPGRRRRASRSPSRRSRATRPTGSSSRSGSAASLRRHWRKALRRLRAILEEDRDRGARATIAGGPRKPATGLRVREPIT